MKPRLRAPLDPRINLLISAPAGKCLEPLRNDFRVNKGSACGGFRGANSEPQAVPEHDTVGFGGVVAWVNKGFGGWVGGVECDRAAGGREEVEGAEGQTGAVERDVEVCEGRLDWGIERENLLLLGV